MVNESIYGSIKPRAADRNKPVLAVYPITSVTDGNVNLDVGILDDYFIRIGPDLKTLTIPRTGKYKLGLNLSGYFKSVVAADGGPVLYIDLYVSTDGGSTYSVYSTKYFISYFNYEFTGRPGGNGNVIQDFTWLYEEILQLTSGNRIYAVFRKSSADYQLFINGGCLAHIELIR